MSETPDVVNSLPAIILLSFWWAFLTMAELLSRQREAERMKTNAHHPSGEMESNAIGPSFPKLQVLDPTFEYHAFLKGARRAYEEVLRAYAICDTKTLQTLLSADVFQAFSETCKARSERGETLELTLVGIRSAEIARVEIGVDLVEIEVLFCAEIIQAERSATGTVISGDPTEIAAMADLWTFARHLPIDGVAWTVVATDEALKPA
ncbi:MULTISPECIES: Tim44/TimA family putative adaptor protein [Mesorhizobium]|uniref:Tim44 domain-containing protein n=1 Tax=Mesorhizobium denitrificans TaxID=2294114 RepID=A0A371X3X8_9HYPH|nr:MULTISPECIES: Tim44/TimA family putative adaptor protein [Mesorhizobium]RFC63923.1 Tim44 domain-containing protein [Mesorhizobium denitrificans]